MKLRKKEHENSFYIKGRRVPIGFNGHKNVPDTKLIFTPVCIGCRQRVHLFISRPEIWDPHWKGRVTRQINMEIVDDTWQREGVLEMLTVTMLQTGRTDIHALSTPTDTLDGLG